MHFEARAHQFGGDVSLQIGEAEYQIGLEFDDARGAGARGGRTVKPEMPTMRQSSPRR
jgi:hypothetical protein